MTSSDKLKIQALLDGGLDPAEARQVAEWLEHNPEARQLHQDLGRIRDLLRAHEPQAPLPVTPDYYWAALQSRLASAQAETAPALPVRRMRWTPVAWWWKYLAPAGGAVLLALLVSLPFMQPAPEVAETEYQGLEVETVWPEARIVTYRSDTEGISVVWVNTQD